ncbi:MAG TPA: 4Fe-4S double cluster binding domain-containing protein, partial [Rectinemataceae bacterium]|nr:4Fe-4S double cluster binding domain-containing protein [Rectinemataceae bacterium]
MIRRLLAEKLSSQGLFAFGFLPRASFLDVLEKTGTSSAAMSKYDVEKTESVVAVALRYGEGNFSLPAWAERSIEESGGGGSPPPASRVPMMGIGHFARANWYMELSRRMMGAVAGAIQDAANMGLSLPPPKAWRRLVNSGLPEKPLAARAGLGWIGKNGILIADSRHKAGEMDHDEMLSSALVLGLILCPIDIGGEAGEPMREGCGDCCRCIKACPTGALGKSPSGYERSLCIQHWTALDGLPPDEVRTAWGDRLYGCDTCLEACPYFKTDPSATTDIGLIGPELPAKYFLSTEEATIRRDLSGTALD